MTRPAQRAGRNGESGYALITILFLLGVVAVMLARSLPRDAMNAERTREETLIYRGEQYARAVKLYFRANQKYPESMDDLEEEDGVRYLRRRYRDPITGDDEWRLIKMGSDGRFEDSLVYDTEKDDGAGGRTTPAAQAFAAAQLDLKRTAPNIVGSTRMSAAPTNPFQVPGGTAGGAFAFPGQPGAATPDSEQPQIGPDGQPTRGSAGDYSQVLPSQVPSDAGQRDPRLGPGPVPAAISGMAPQQAQPYSGQPLAPDSVSPQAASLIGDLLTKPRPGGLAGLQGQTAPQGGATVTFQEGIAGVASKSERSGVKVYKDRDYYNEWEFVYDYRKDALTGTMAVPGVPEQGGNINQGQPGLTPSGILGGNPGARQGTPFGLPGMNPGTPQQTQPRSPIEPTDPRGTQQPTEGGRRTRRTTRPRSPAEFRPATPVPPTPEENPTPEQVEPPLLP